MDRVANCQRCSWAEVWKFSAIEWLNTYCYCLDKDAAKERQDMENGRYAH